MSLDGTSLKEGTRVVTYGCGEHFPLEAIAGKLSPPSQDDQDRQVHDGG